MIEFDNRKADAASPAKSLGARSAGSIQVEEADVFLEPEEDDYIEGAENLAMQSLAAL